MKRKKKVGKSLRKTLSRSSRAASASRSTLYHYPRHTERWSEREDRLLVALRKQFATRFGEPSAIYRVAERLGRTPAAVQKRLDILGARKRFGKTVRLGT